MLSNQFFDFLTTCSDPLCANNDEDSGYICADCQTAWLTHLSTMSYDDLYEFYILNQDFLDDDEYLSYMVDQLGIEVDNPKEYIKNINFKFFNNLFFDKFSK